MASSREVSASLFRELMLVKPCGPRVAELELLIRSNSPFHGWAPAWILAFTKSSSAWESSAPGWTKVLAEAVLAHIPMAMNRGSRIFISLATITERLATFQLACR